MDRKKLAELMAEYQGMAQKERPVFRFGDTGEPGGPLDIMDSMSGAPFRMAVRTAQEGDLAGSVRSFMQSFGKDPRNAPSMEDIAIRAGVPEGPASTAAGLLGGFAEPGLPFGAAMGAVKRVGKSNILDATEEFLKRRQSGPDKLAQAQGRLDQPIVKMDEAIGFDPKNPEHVEKAAQGAMKYGPNPEAANEQANRMGRVAEKQLERNLFNKLGKRFDDPEINQTLLTLTKRTQNPAAVIQAQQSKLDVPYVKVSDVSFPLPNYNYVPKNNVLGKPGVKEPFAGDANQDFFPWHDKTYKVGKRILENAKGPLTINTSTDLLAVDEYLNAIPEGSVVNLYSPGADWIQRNLYPGNPSAKRLMTAAQKLDSAGIKVNVINPKKSELVKRAKKLGFDEEFINRINTEVLYDE